MPKGRGRGGRKSGGFFDFPGKDAKIVKNAEVFWVRGSWVMPGVVESAWWKVDRVMSMRTPRGGQSFKGCTATTRGAVIS
jgi:hypothetical protein